MFLEDVKCATIKYSLGQYLELCITPEKTHTVVQFDCNTTVTCVSESDLQAFCLPGKLQKVGFFASFLSSVREKWI